MMPRPRACPILLALAACLLTAPRATAQGTYTWSGSGSDWLNAGNWTGGASGTWPGVTTATNAADGNPFDLAVVGATRPGGNNLGIDMSAAGGGLAVGGLLLDVPDNGSSAQIWLGSSTTNGSLQLNGSAFPVSGVANVILANTSSGGYDLRLFPAVPVGGNQQMTLRLGTANGVVLVNPGRSIRIDTAVADASGVAGGFTLQGGGTLTMAGTHSYTGTTAVVGSVLKLQTFGSTLPSAIGNRGWVEFGLGVNANQSGNLSGPGAFYSIGTSTLTLSGTNTHTGSFAVSSGGLTFGAAGSVGGAAARYLFRDNVTVSATYALNQGLLDRIDPNSFGFVALGANSSNNLSVPAALADRISLGATSVFTYSGTLTTAGTAYRLGGGGNPFGASILTVSSVLANAGGTRGVIVAAPGSSVTTVVLTGANTYTGPTVIDGHATLQVGTLPDGGVVGPLGASSSAAGNLVLRGGTLSYTGANATTDRGFSLAAGGNINIATAGVKLTFDGDLVRTPATTLNVTGPGILALDTLNGNPLSSGLVNGVFPWATVNGTSFATTAGRPLAAATPDYVVSGSNPLSGASATSNVLIDSSQSNQTISSPGKTINSLITSKQVSINGTLTLASGGLIMQGAGTTTLSSGGSAGFLTAGSQNTLYIHTPSTGTLPEMDVRVGIVDNGAAVALVKAGPGTLVLRGPNSYSGGTTINGGFVYLDSPGVGAGPGTLGAGALTINEGSGPTSTFAPNGLTTALLVRSAAGIVPNNITIGPGRGGVVGIGSTGTASGANVIYSGNITVNRPTVLQGGIGEASGGTSFTGRFSGTGDLVVTVTSSLNRVVFAPSGTNSYGNLFLSNGSTLQLGNDSVSSNRMIPDTSNVYFAPGSALWIGTTSSGVTTDGETVNALVSQSYGAGQIRSTKTGIYTTFYTLTVGAGNGSGEFSGAILQDPGWPQLGITKVGTGTQILAGAGTNTGATRVEAGTLLINNLTGSGTGAGAVTVAGGTLGGNGTITPTWTGGQVVIQAAGTLTAGTQAGPGQTDLTISGNGLVMDPGSTYRVRVFGTGPDDNSRVNVLGTGTGLGAQINTNKLVLDLAGVDVVALRNAVGAYNTRTYTVMSAEQLYSANGAATPGFDAAGFSIVNDPGFAPGEWQFGSFDTLNGIVTVTFTPIPEPGAVLAFGAAGLGLVRLVRGRQRRDVAL